MKTRAFTTTITLAGAAMLAAAVEFASPAHSAEAPKAVAKAEVPEGYVLVSQDTLHQMVHDEVARQIQELVRREQQQHEAAGRIQSLSSIPTMARAQIALYQLQHRDQTPTLEQMGDGFKFLMLTTDAAGHPSDANNSVGPYLQHPLVNPLTGKSKLAAPGKATAADGWIYDSKTGMVKAVVPRQFEPQLKGRVPARDVEFVD